METSTKIYFLIIGLSFLASLAVYFQKELPRYLLFFPPFLLLSFILVIIGWQMALQYGSNHALYNLYLLLFYGFYAFILSKVIWNKKARKLLIYISCVYLLISVPYIVFWKLNEFQYWVYFTGAFFIVFFCLFYLVELIRFRPTGRLSREPSFWICCSLLYDYCGSVVMLGTSSLLIDFSPELMSILNWMINAVSYIYYILLSVAFVCRLKKNNTSQKTYQ